MRRSCLVLLISALIAAPLAYAQTSPGTPVTPSATITSFASAGGDFGLIQAGDGNFYLMDINANFDQITPSGTVNQLAKLSTCSVPAGIIQGSDGNFYGTCLEGGLNSGGLIFKYSLTGGFTDLYDFPSGSRPGGPPTQAADGAYYGIVGVIPGSVPGDTGSVYHLVVTSNTATVTNVATFVTSEAELQSGSMVQANDGNFYGFSFSGGTYEGGNCCGTFYRFEPSDNSITALFVFDISTAGGEADAPIGNPAVAPDGVTMFSGTDGGGGDDFNSGSLVSVNTSGTENTAYNFEADAQEQPQTLFLGGDGNFYGVTTYGDIGSTGGNGTGTMFQLTPAGTFTQISDFVAATGNNPYAYMLQAADGNFYGTTSGGVIYKAVVTPTPVAPVIVTASSSSVLQGNSVTLTWQVNNATSETFSQCYAHSTDPGWTGLQALSGTQSVTPPAVGTYVYGLTCGGIESGYATVTAEGVVNTTTAISASANPVQLGQTETFTITVTPSTGNGVPTGNVTVSYLGRVLGTGTLVSGSATVTYSVPNNLPIGTYQLVATYSGDTTDNASTSSPLAVRLVRAATTTGLTASPNPVAQGSDCTLTATVTSADGTPTGTVTFFFGPNALGTATLSNGTAQLTEPTTGEKKMTYGITAQYNGDSLHQPSNSAVVDVTID